MTMKDLLKLFVICFLSLQAIGQQEPMVSQYMFNGLFLNPAYAGSHKYFSSTLIYRSQWVGFEGGPKTMILALDGPLNNKKMGVGLVLCSDRIGIIEQTDVIGNYSYNVRLGNGKLAFGIKAGIAQLNARFTDAEFEYWDSQDPIYIGNIQRALVPSFGAGAYYYVDNRWYIGASVPTLLAYQKSREFSMNINEASSLKRHLYLTGGYIFSLSDNWSLKTSSLAKFITAAPIQLDINLNLLFKEMFWMGVSYRTGDALVTILEYQANKRFRIGYAYDFTLTEMRNYSLGTHEVMLGFDFGKEFIKVKTPRLF